MWAGFTDNTIVFCKIDIILVSSRSWRTDLFTLMLMMLMLLLIIITMFMFESANAFTSLIIS